MEDRSGRKIIPMKEAAEELGVDVKTIARWMDAGDLSYIWVGGRRRLTRELWEHFINQRTTTGPLE